MPLQVEERGTDEQESKSSFQNSDFHGSSNSEPRVRSSSEVGTTSFESGFQIHTTKYERHFVKYQVHSGIYIPNTHHQTPNTHSQTPGGSQEFWVWFPELWVLQPTNLFKRSGVIRLFNKKRGLETKCITIIFTLRPWSLQTSSYTQACKSEVSPHQCRVKKQQSWNPCWTGVTIKHSITTFSSWCFINWMKTTKTRCGRMNGILVGGQRKLVIIWWHWSLSRQRSDTSYDRSWPGVQRRRQVWVQTIIDTLWICFKIDLFIWKILCCEVLTNFIKTGFWKWGRAQCLEDQRDPKWWVYTLVVPSGTYIIVVVGDGGCCRLMVFVSSFAIFSRSRKFKSICFFCDGGILACCHHHHF